MTDIAKLKAEIRHWQRAYWRAVDDGIDEDFRKKRIELRKKASEKYKQAKKTAKKRLKKPYSAKIAPDAPFLPLFQ